MLHMLEVWAWYLQQAQRMKMFHRWCGLGLCCWLLLSVIGCAVQDQQAAGQPSTATAARTATVARTATPARPTPTLVPVNSAVAAAGGQTVRLDDPLWQGSYRRSGRPTVYGGRSATWIYGVGTDYSAMQAQFELAGEPAGAAELRIEGMDSEDRARTHIQITLNGQLLFDGPNPLPDDDLPLESGTWASASWTIPEGLLRPGTNTLRIANLSPGQFSRPPFFMLDYAEIRYQQR